MGDPQTQTMRRDTFVQDRLPPKDLWPDLVIDLPELVYPDRLNCAAALLDGAIAAGHGDRPCFIGADGVWTYRDVADRVGRIASVLVDHGIVAGNRVLLRAPNNPMMMACWLAVLKVGAVAVATMPMLRARELVVILNRADISHALVDARLMVEMDLARPEVPHLTTVLTFGDHLRKDNLERLMALADPDCPTADTAADDVALIAFTSGTTGVPKGCVHFHRDVLINADTFSRHILRPVASDIFCGSPPIAFTFGLGGLVVFPMRVGAASILTEAGPPESLAIAIAQYRATVCFTAPTAYRQLATLSKTYDLSSLRRCVSAGEPLPVATRTLFKDATGIDLIDGIGGTEMLHIFIAAADGDIRPGATGKPVPGFRAEIQDDSGHPVPPGTIGRLAVKGPLGCRYLDDPRQTDYVKNGWNMTGDTYVMDADGYFWFQARSDDMIVSSGYNISGPEVESVLLEHPDVRECAVVASPDPDRGMVVKAFIVLAPEKIGSDGLIKEMQDFVKARIAPYKYPRAIAFVDALPRTETGKLQRFVLRQRERAKAAEAV